MPALTRFAYSLAIVAFFAGCNEGRSVGGNNADPHAPDSYVVRGAMTYEGAPIDGEATFTPVDGGDPIAVPVKSGSYELQAPPGKYRVALSGTAGDAELPADLAVERSVGADTQGQTVNISLPEANPEAHQGSTPAEVRELPVSGAPVTGEAE